MTNSDQRKRGFIRNTAHEFLGTIFSYAFWSGLRKDFKEIHAFYLDDETRQALKQSSPFARVFKTTFRILGALYAKLTPMRQALLVLALILFVFPDTHWEDSGSSLNLTWSPFGFIVLLFILLLELKDKLLAKDELRAGHSVQEALMPSSMPSLEGWDIWMHTTPANDVGGDLVDYLALDGGRLDVTIADVAGKGLGAALMAAKLQATLRAIAPESPSLETIAQRLNTILCRDGVPSRFATLAYLRLSAGSPAVRILNAGHIPPTILRKNGIEQLKRAAPAIGLTEQAQFAEQEIALAAGEILILVSDGVLEARNGSDEFFGEERFQRLLESLRGLSAKALGEALLFNVEEFIGSASRSDDISLVIAAKIH